jgi:hypothetical protein
LGRQELLGYDAAGDGGGLRAKLEAGLRLGLAEREGGCGEKVKRVLSFFSKFLLKHSNQLNSNKSLNPNTQKSCTDMNATGNSYISLIN